MAFEPPWILAPSFLECLMISGLPLDQAAQTIREIIRSTRRMPPTAAAPSPAEPPIVRYALPEVARLDRPLDCETLDIPTSTITAVGKMYGDVWAMPRDICARVEFWAVDVKRLFPPTTIKRSGFRNPSDALLVANGVAGIKNGKFANAFQAAKVLGPQASDPADVDQKIDRLRKAIAKEVAKDRQS
jgi:hypothetical protein